VPPATEVLPRWSVSDVHESLESRSFVLAHEQLEADIGRLVALYDQHGIAGVEPHEPTAAELAACDVVLTATNDVMTVSQELNAYVYAFVTTDSYDDRAQGLLSQLNRLDADLRQLHARLTAWVGALGAEALAAGSPVAAAHAYPLQRLAVRATHQMSGPEEELYALLSVTGSAAWGRLYEDVVSQMKVPLVLDGEATTAPMPGVRALVSHPDPVLRRAAYDAELAAWPTVATPLAGAFNAIKGEAIEVNARRKWADPLDASIYANGIDRTTFDAMAEAIVAALPDFRRYLCTKARLLGHTGALPWWDLAAPLPFGTQSVTWDEGRRTVESSFGAYSPSLAHLAERAAAERWIDAGPRDGKRGGAFCMGLSGDRSLVLLNWSGTPDGVQTLAHELGHAYHNVQLADRTPLQRQLAMATAETASIFCETLVVEEGLRRSSGLDRLALLDVDLAGSCQVIVDIWSRFLFERSAYSARRDCTLSSAELCELMTRAQEEAYGDGLDQTTAHPWMWAAKPHYYLSHFYNWPYAFGLLFGLGLHACYVRDPEQFRSGYDSLLADVGVTPTAELARAFGIDIQQRPFWEASFDTLRGRIAEYERLAAELGR
jgi:pepF/M3 family oligoendopeptidase